LCALRFKNDFWARVVLQKSGKLDWRLRSSWLMSTVSLSNKVITQLINIIIFEKEAQSAEKKLSETLRAVLVRLKIGHLTNDQYWVKVYKRFPEF
jgi:hypothetical protein